MPIDQAEAIVLRTYAIGDQDKIAVFLTRDKGVIRGVAKGARKFGNRFGSSLEPMSHVTMFYYEKERKDLVTINTCDLIESFFEVQADLKMSLTLSYFAELIEEFVPVRAREDIVFRLLAFEVDSQLLNQRWRQVNDSVFLAFPQPDYQVLSFEIYVTYLQLPLSHLGPPQAGFGCQFDDE